ncbi:DUF2334 domain-containing protein [Brevibacillus formosus]|uniref:DUF2334 domain-containing protein n=1 Tax=Brevibacillus formosus TaxID=54913 RepID=UPI003F1C8C30
MPNKSWNNTFNNRCRIVVSLLVVLLLLAGTGGKLYAAVGAEQEPEVLVVYSTQDGALTDEVRMLDLVLGHFSSKLTYVADEVLTERDLDGVTHLVYYGSISKDLSRSSRQIMQRFQGTWLALGKNVEQLGERFSFFQVNGQVDIQKVSKPQGVDQVLLNDNYLVGHISLSRGDVLLEGWKGMYTYPLMVQNGKTAYFASSNFTSPFSLFVAEALHEVFKQPHDEGRYALIRLEDVHPHSDPKLVWEAGSYLADKGIPFVIALIPVYKNSETNEMVHLKDRPEMLKVLRELQKRGASIVLHGYMHHYRNSETGEGSEFWDIENNTPVSKAPEDETPLKKRHAFASQTKYETYQRSLKEYEELYIQKRIETGIKELTELGLAPVAFEAPHYTMSQKGYEVMARYFPYVLGQLQFNDRDWIHMGAPPFVSKPAFLHGMTILPETVGYYDPASSTPMQDIKDKYREVSFVRDGMVSMFFHPYLGIKPLKEMIAYVETLPDVKWMDVRGLSGQEISLDSGQEASEPPILVESLEEQGLTLKASDIYRNFQDFLRENGWVQLVLWGIAGLVSIMVILFMLYTWRNRANLRKQLFMERDLDG